MIGVANPRVPQCFMWATSEREAARDSPKNQCEADHTSGKMGFDSERNVERPPLAPELPPTIDTDTWPTPGENHEYHPSSEP